MTSELPSDEPPHLGAWALQITLAGIFVVLGAATLAQVPAVVDSIDQIGLGRAFRVSVGVVELVGAAAIAMPDIAVLGALWLAAAMAFAVLIHRYILQDDPTRSVVLMLLCALVAVLRGDQVPGWGPRSR